MSHSILALVRNIKVKCSFEQNEVLDNIAIEKALSVLNSSLKTSISYNSALIYKKSVDARDRNNILLVYTVAAPVPDKFAYRSYKGIDFVKATNHNSLFELSKKISSPPVVVGFGPSGMFCALALAKCGLQPIVIERGSDVDKRRELVDAYWNESVLNPESNVQFGEGGAGTFSDGKLLTRISDTLCSFVISEFIRHGAPDEIRYLAKPHIGTDNLRRIVKSIRNEIIELGGKVFFDTRFDGISADLSGRVKSIYLSDGNTVECDSLFLCIGHSARDTVKKLMVSGVHVEPKPFSVGVRIEHLQSDIDKSLYGNYVGAPCLGAGQYTLSRRYGNRAVYSFCMCPGGTVVASSSEDGQIVTNGMSYYARDGLNANSAIAVSVNTSDYGGTVEGAIGFQEKIERKAFVVSGSDNSAPIQLLSDFFDGKAQKEPTKILPTYTGKTVIRNANMVFPKFITEGLQKGISDFEKDIEGFSCPDAVLTFPETRTSSPVRIPRDINYLALGFSNLYPCGEGAGYAGGITSAAVDGLRAALCYLKK